MHSTAHRRRPRGPVSHSRLDGRDGRLHNATRACPCRHGRRLAATRAAPAAHRGPGRVVHVVRRRCDLTVSLGRRPLRPIWPRRWLKFAWPWPAKVMFLKPSRTGWLLADLWADRMDAGGASDGAHRLRASAVWLAGYHRTLGLGPPCVDADCLAQSVIDPVTMQPVLDRCVTATSKMPSCTATCAAGLSSAPRPRGRGGGDGRAGASCEISDLRFPPGPPHRTGTLCRRSLLGNAEPSRTAEDVQCRPEAWGPKRRTGRQGHVLGRVAP